MVELVHKAGGAPLGAYREPLGGRPLLLASLPFSAVQPTPFQRDLSPTHAKRLAGAIEATAAFLDPLIVVRGEDGRFWTPNGRHRLAAAKMLGPQADHRAHLARRNALVSHPRAEHREGAQPQGQVARGRAHGAQSREARADAHRGVAGRRVRSGRAAHARPRLRRQPALRRRRVQPGAQEGGPPHHQAAARGAARARGIREAPRRRSTPR